MNSLFAIEAFYYSSNNLFPLNKLKRRTSRLWLQPFYTWNSLLRAEKHYPTVLKEMLTPLMQSQRCLMLRSTRKMQTQESCQSPQSKSIYLLQRQYLPITASRVQNNVQTGHCRREQERSRAQYVPWENRLGFQHAQHPLASLGEEQCYRVSEQWFWAPGSAAHPPQQQALSHHRWDDHQQRYPQPTRLSHVYGNTFTLCWRFLGSDLGRPLFLSNMFRQIPSEISFIHSSSLTQWARLRC